MDTRTQRRYSYCYAGCGQSFLEDFDRDARNEPATNYLARAFRVALQPECHRLLQRHEYAHRREDHLPNPKHLPIIHPNR